MDIAAMSMDLASTRLQTSVGISLAKKVMETAEINAEGLTEMLEAVPNPASVPIEPHMLDVLV